MSKISLHHYLTFGRDLRFILVLATNSLLILFGLLPGSPPIINWPLERNLAFFVSIGIGIGLLILLYILVSAVSKMTYSVTMSNTMNRLVSVALYLTLGLIATSIGYVLFVQPFTDTQVFGPLDYSTGVVASLSFALLVCTAHVLSMLDSINPRKRSKLLQRVQQNSEAIKNQPGSSLGDAEREFVTDLSVLIGIVENEPMSGIGELEAELQNFKENYDSARTLIEKKKLLKNDWSSSVSRKINKLM